MEYRLPKIEDEIQIKDYIKNHIENNEEKISASNMLTTMKYKEWVKKIINNSITPDEIWGRPLTYLVFDNDKLIGLLNIRYELSHEMTMKYGNIGYSVRPSERRKGYATKILEFALKECKRLNMNRVILGCYKGNIGLAKTIRKNGGHLINEVTEKTKISNECEIDIEKEYYEINI